MGLNEVVKDRNVSKRIERDFVVCSRVQPNMTSEEDANLVILIGEYDSLGTRRGW